MQNEWKFQHCLSYLFCHYLDFYYDCNLLQIKLFTRNTSKRHYQKISQMGSFSCNNAYNVTYLKGSDL